MVPSGEIFSRPSSVRWMTSASTPIRSGCARMRAASARFSGCSMNSARAYGRADQRRDHVRILLRPVLPHREHLLRRAHQDVGDEMQDVADAEIDRDRIPGRADAERIDLAAGEAVDHVGRRQHHQPHVLVGIDAARRHPEPQLVIVGRERKGHAEGQRLGAALAPLARPRAPAPSRSPSDRSGSPSSLAHRSPHAAPATP